MVLAALPWPCASMLMLGAYEEMDFRALIRMGQESEAMAAGTDQDECALSFPPMFFEGLRWGCLLCLLLVDLIGFGICLLSSFVSTGYRLGCGNYREATVFN